MVDALGGAIARLMVNELVTRVGLNRIYSLYVLEIVLVSFLIIEDMWSFMSECCILLMITLSMLSS